MNADKEFVYIEWEKLMSKLGVSKSKYVPVFERISEAYEGLERHHHNFAHIRMCLEYVNEALHLATNPHEIKFAILFHDFINKIGGSNNEVRSGHIAIEAIKELGLGHDFAKLVLGFIKTTTHKVGTRDEEKGRTIDQDIMADVDLAILGQGEMVYDAYVKNIRKEYDTIPDEIFYPKRLEIMEGFLKRKFIYRTVRFSKLFKEQARKNIEREISLIKEML